MRQSGNARSILVFLPLLFASYALADQSNDRVNIARTIGRLNDPRTFGTLLSTDVPTVTISHEPWGEATFNFPAMARFECGNIRFVTTDVALADGTLTYQDVTMHTIPLLFVVKRKGAGWKIASIRPLASQP